MKSIRIAALAAAVGLVASVAQAETSAVNGSTTLTTTPTPIFSDDTGARRTWMFLDNVSPAGSPSAWCTDIDGTTPAPNAPGSFEIAPGIPNVREYNSPLNLPSHVPQTQVTCVAASGTVALTAEAN